MKAAVITFTSCFGCSFEFLNLEKDLIKVFEKVDFVDFKLIKEENFEERYDVAFVEGGITRKEEVKKVKKVREKSKIVVALGACACNGCVLTIKNYRKDSEKEVYGKNLFDSIRVSPIDEYIKVDYYLRGCPFFKHELISLIKSLSIGKAWREKTYNVCVECRKQGNDCLLEKKVLCLGPLSRAGCKAICPTNGYPCVGCRGFAEDKNLEEFFNIVKKWASKKELKEKLEMYNLYEEVKGSEAWKKLK